MRGVDNISTSEHQNTSISLLDMWDLISHYQSNFLPDSCYLLGSHPLLGLK